MTEAEQEQAEQLEAMTRQTFNPETGTCDDRKRRVTDLTRPLPERQEAFIEVRRSVHARIYEDYRQEFCNKMGVQKTNLTEQEQRGLKKLQKRMKEEDLIIMKTDKSEKFPATYLQEYIRMGQEHTSKDKIINRSDIRKN